ncbi:uncharacterized protein LOC131952835 isoform X2 [Physella acuta]|uniref:uncharacterized protein LOC131952835 isoform X2 n=1 Tax=Physella acuta TaxID=109671 RepID=UPI0027DBC8E4|nr:uncharacterized protein LOC131952835 isoform X2 [Physella acuta]
MSEKTDVDQEHEDNVALPGELPEHQYSKEELYILSKSPASLHRPKCLEKAYDSEDGKWDPDKWYKAKFGQSREASPLTLVDSKDRRRGIDLERDIKRRPSLNDPIERLKEERDGIVLSPQRRSFGTGCHVQTQVSYTRQISMPERDRDDTKIERERERERDRERIYTCIYYNRDRPVRRIGSGRIQIDRENTRDFSGLRDRFDDREVRERDTRDRDFVWNRDRDRDREWDRDTRERDRDNDWDREKERRFDRSDRFRRIGDRDFPERERRDRDFRDRDRGFERTTRRRNYKDEEKEPEWFTGGPTSQTDTIELRGFEREGEQDHEEANSQKSETISKINNVKRKTEDKLIKDSSEECVEKGKVSQCNSPKEVHSVHHSNNHEKSAEGIHSNIQQEMSRSSPNSHKFDIEQILQADLPLGEETIPHGSRFSRFFTGPNIMGSDASSMEDMLVPRDLLEDNHSSPSVPSPTSMIGPMGAMHGFLGHTHHGMHHFHDQLAGHDKEHLILSHLMTVPNSAGDNNAAVDKSSALPPSVTALFNSAAMGGSNACKWKPHLDCSVETLESSYFSNSAISSNNSFSTQDAEAQLKAMLFGGYKDSASSSGTASPASLPASVHRKVKTVAELEADMHQSSPQKSESPQYTSNMENIKQGSSSDMTAFNKLLIMINAASEANQNAAPEPSMNFSGYGMVPSHSEFNHAMLRNKEEQMQLLQRSLQSAQVQQPPQFPSHHHHQQVPPPLPPQQQSTSQIIAQQQAHSVALQQLQKQQLQMHAMQQVKHLGMLHKPPSTPGIPQAMSTPHNNSAVKPRAQSGGPTCSSDPIFNLIQQNPTIVMKPASPAPTLAALIQSQQSAVPPTARVPSPLMFSQQPPLHLSAPSPIHPGQLSPRSLTVAGNTMSSPSGLHSPVLPRVLSPQELSAHAQAVMQSALIKKQLQDQNERYLKKQQERARSPNQLNFVKPQPAAHPVLPPTPQSKGATVDTFTPTSVLLKMHSDKAIEKEKHALEIKPDLETDKPSITEYMPSMHDLNAAGQNDIIDMNTVEEVSHKSDAKLAGDLSDISFLDPVNPNLVAMSNQLENMRIGQTNILPGTLSQPMSVEEKLKLSALAEKPGYLSLMLDKARAGQGIGQGRPIVKASQEISPEERSLLQHQNVHGLQPQIFMQQPPSVTNPVGRPVTGSGSKILQSSMNSITIQTSTAPPSSLQQNNMPGKQVSGRAIVGGSCIQQMAGGASNNSAQTLELMRMLEQQQLQHLQRRQVTQSMGIPPPPMGTPISHLGPPPVGVHMTGHFPVVASPVHPATNAMMMNHQFARANAINVQQRNQQISQFMAMQQTKTTPQHRIVNPMHSVVHGAPISPHNQAGPLSPAALTATIQRVASPHGMKMNGPMPSSTNINGSGKGDVGGIQRWFGSDILKTQLSSMPPLPTQGSHVMTVDELERN